MIILDSTSLALRGYVFTSPRTTNLDYNISWIDHTSTTVTPGVSTGTLSSTSATDLVAAPASSTQRQIVEVSMYNPDTQPAYVVLLYTSSVNVYSGWLQPEEHLHYEENTGFYKMDRMGARIQIYSDEHLYARPGLHAYHNNSNFYIGFHDCTNLTATRTITTTNTVCQYLGPYNPSSGSESTLHSTPALTASVRYRVTTAAATITWAELAIYAGNPNGGNVTLRLLGYADISGVVNSTGQKTTTVNLTTAGSGLIIPPGIGLWAAFGNQATTALVLRAGIAPRIQAGYLTDTSLRPSTAGNTAAMTEDTSGACIWCTAVIT